MKTKIIYISGSEVFDVADIRGAFEEVRTALGLSQDTVLFGVPVDADDAGLATVKTAEVSHLSETAPVEEVLEPTLEVPEYVEEAEEVIETPVIEKPKRGRKAKAKIEEEEIVESTEDKVIPILSILSSKADAEPEVSEEIAEEPEIEEVAPEVVEPVMEPAPEVIRIESVAVEKVTIKKSEEEETITTQSVSIEDITNTEEPENGLEKTLEQLLEKMAPLREDLIEEDSAVHKSEEEPEEETVAAEEEPESDVDATLEQLATEFATKQDEIVTTPNTAPAGKIGKLKNILPFKKAKREESGLMGDLFGWAGIAANDDEFSIPGFFTAEASKK